MRSSWALWFISDTCGFKKARSSATQHGDTSILSPDVYRARAAREASFVSALWVEEVIVLLALALLLPVSIEDMIAEPAAAADMAAVDAVVSVAAVSVKPRALSSLAISCSSVELPQPVGNTSRTQQQCQQSSSKIHAIEDQGRTRWLQKSTCQCNAHTLV